ncbi:glutathione S-transferase family protein [Paraburkholderia sediminicola]|uniref:glutathione S-transferase family protein n=1 Tax=Paraburkholderia sediminicola TaxID=458836 RepID=UPI0038B7ECC5
MTYRLYYSPGACSMAVHIVLNELGVDFQLERVPVSEGATLSASYTAINPKARVPALGIPGEAGVLTELPAILTYLGRRHPEGGLLPTTNALDEARCHEWLAWLADWVHGVGFGGIWRPGRFSAETAHFDGIRASGRRTILDSFGDVERHFADGRLWAVPCGYTMVEPFMLVLYRWGNRIGLDMRRHYPAWTAVSERVVARPAVRRTFEREGVSIDG